MATKKASSKKKDTKQGNRITRALKSINFTSRRTQFILFISLIAVIGGGVYTYRSFAATAQGSYSIGNRLYIRDSTEAGGRCTSRTQTEAQKNNMRIAVLACPGGNARNSATAYVNLSADEVGRGMRRACFMVKGAGNVSGTFANYINLVSTVPTAEMNRINSNSYTEVCTPWANQTNTAGLTASINLNNSRAGIVTVSFIRIDRY